MLKFVIAIVMLPIILILALPASAMLINEVRLWVFARQLSELDGLFDPYVRVLATGSEVYQSGNDSYCSFTASRLYSYFERKEDIEKIVKIINEKKFKTAKPTKDTSPIDHQVYFSNGFLAVTLTDGHYDAGLDIRCW